MTVMARIAAHALAHLLAGMIRLYQLSLSAVTPAHCRYLPTCSAYAQEAVLRLGPIAGTWLALRRVARCHPWGGSGYDPVPRPSAPPVGSDA